MIKHFSQIQLQKLIICCITWTKNQKLLSSYWKQIKFMYFKQEGTISILSGKPLRLVHEFTYLGSNISSTGCNVSICIRMTWTAINDVVDHVEIWFIWLHKTVLLLIWNYDGTTIWRHHMEFNKNHGEKALWGLHKNVTCYIEQILEAALY